MPRRQRLDEITTEQRTKIINSIRAGSTVSVACAFAQVNRGDYYDWMRLGRAASGAATSAASSASPPAPEAEFVAEIEKAQSAREVELLLRIEDLARRTDPKKAGGDPRTALQAIKWSLQHIGPNRQRYQDRWEVTGKDNGPIEIDIKSEWGALREVVLNALSPFPEAREAVARALAEHTLASAVAAQAKPDAG